MSQLNFCSTFNVIISSLNKSSKILIQKPFPVKIIQKKPESVFKFCVVEKFSSDSQVFVCLLHQAAQVRQWAIGKPHRKKQKRVNCANNTTLHEAVVDLNQ